MDVERLPEQIRPDCVYMDEALLEAPSECEQCGREFTTRDGVTIGVLVEYDDEYRYVYPLYCSLVCLLAWTDAELMPEA